MSARIIKKYANRRLYDTTDSKYVTLKDIKNIITLGQDVQIIDDTTNEDLTRGLLMQILSEQELGGRPILSKAVLKQLIRFYGHPMQDTMSSYISTSVNQFLGQLEAMQTQMEALLEASPFSDLQEFTNKNMQAMADFQKQFFSPMTKPSKQERNDNE